MASMSVRSALGNSLTAALPRATTRVGTNCRILENDQRLCGKREKLPSAKRIVLLGAGGEPAIHPIATGSLALASSGAQPGWAPAKGAAKIIVFKIIGSKKCLSITV